MQPGEVHSAKWFARLRWESIAAAGAAAAFVVLLFVGSGPPERPRTGPMPVAEAPGSKPRLVTAAEAGALTERFGPVYWFGPRRGTVLELAMPSSDRVFLRYLPAGQPAGTTTVYPYVATYKVQRPLDRVRASGNEKGAKIRRVPGGGLAVQNPRDGVVRIRGGRTIRVVFLAYPNSDRLVEIFGGSARKSLAIAASGRVRPVR